MLEEYDDGPFIAGKSISAADIYWAPFLERMAAQLPVFYPSLAPRTTKESRFEAISEWYDAMDAQVPCYASRIKGRAEVWQARLADEMWLEDKVKEARPVAVPDLPRRRFDGDAVWARCVPRAISRRHPRVLVPRAMSRWLPHVSHLSLLAFIPLW